MASVVKDLLDYDGETGAFTWRQTFSSHAIKGRAAGCFRKDGYLMIRVGKKLMYAHRLAILLHTGVEPAGIVDHIDGNPSNNRVSNLRVITQAGNTQNRRRANKNSRTRVRGVSVNRYGKYCAQVMVNRVHVYREVFDDISEASKAVQNARKIHMEYSDGI
jgi:hypothetical protein